MLFPDVLWSSQACRALHPHPFIESLASRVCMGSIALWYCNVGAGLIAGLCLLVQFAGHTCPSVLACVVQAQWKSVCACCLVDVVE